MYQILRKNSWWRYLNEIQPHFIHETERTLFLPLHFNEITLQKSGLTCVPYTILLKKKRKKKSSERQRPPLLGRWSRFRRF